MMIKQSIFFFLMFVSAPILSQQEKYVIQNHEYNATMGGSFDLNQFSAGFDYYSNLNDEQQIGTGIQISLYSYNFNVTKRSFQKVYTQINESYFIELRPHRSYYLDIPIVFAHRTNFGNTSFKVEGGIINGFLLGVYGDGRLRYEEPFLGSRNYLQGWIATHGFRKYTLRTNTAISYFLKSGMGFKLQLGVPIIKMGQKIENIPSNEHLLDNNKQPISIMLHLVTSFKKRLKTR